MNIKELLREQGMHFEPKAMISIEDIKHLLDHQGENYSHGQYMEALKDFYDAMHQQLYDAQLDILQEYLENK